MSAEQKTPFLISPFCIYHYNDPKTNTYRGRISYPIKSRNFEGTEQLTCKPVPKAYGQWTYYGKFYAFSSMIRPIPSGLRLISAEIMKEAPYSTKKIEYAYDPFNTEEMGISFLTWTRPVPETVPLYLHISPSGTSYPSFSKIPPGDNKELWTLNRLGPLYVLVDKDDHITGRDTNLQQLSYFPREKNGIPKFTFIKSDNRCVPSPGGMSLGECFLVTDENIYNPDRTLPRDLLQRIQFYEDQDESDIKKFFQQSSPAVIIISLCVFLVSLITTIIILAM